MTKAEFYKALAGLSGDGWHHSVQGVRCKRGFCPIIAVYKAGGGRKRYNNADYREAAESLALTDATTLDVVTAADITKDNAGIYSRGVKEHRRLAKVLKLLPAV